MMKRKMKKYKQNRQKKKIKNNKLNKKLTNNKLNKIKLMSKNKMINHPLLIHNH